MEPIPALEIFRQRLKSQTGLSPDSFPGEFWQQKPLFIPNLWPGVLPALEFLTDPNYLAGLSLVDHQPPDWLDSRLIRLERDYQPGRRPAVDLRGGPFQAETLTSLPETNWILLLRPLEMLFPKLRVLWDLLSFLPAWRQSDMMISYGVPGGTVLPHQDQYDVFLLQVSGRKQWKLENRPRPPRLLKDLPLQVLADFEPDLYFDCFPGDVLYIPPGHGHFGICREAGLTLSFGFRSPRLTELQAGDDPNPTGTPDTKESLYRDPGRKDCPLFAPGNPPYHRRFYLSQADQKRLSQQIPGQQNNFATESVRHLSHQTGYPPPDPQKRSAEHRLSAEGLAQVVRRRGRLWGAGILTPILMPRPSPTGRKANHLDLYLNGRRFPLPETKSENLDFLLALFTNHYPTNSARDNGELASWLIRILTTPAETGDLFSRACRRLILGWYRAGLLVWEEELDLEHEPVSRVFAENAPGDSEAGPPRPADWSGDRDAIRHIRSVVYLQEQKVPTDLEWDPRDEAARHWLVETRPAPGQIPRPVGTVRLLPDSAGVLRLGRLAVLPAFRGRGIGRDLVKAVIAEVRADVATRQNRKPELALAAQTRLESFYRELGFRPRGEVFREAGIEHREMIHIPETETVL